MFKYNFFVREGARQKTKEGAKMKRVLKTMPIALLTVLFVLALAFAVLTGTTVLSKTTDGVAEAADITISTLTLNDMKNGLGGVDAVDDYTSIGGGWSTRGYYKDGGNIYVDYDYSATLYYTIPAGYKATSVTYTATFGSNISLFKIQKGESGYNTVIANSGIVVDGTTNFTEDFVAGNEFRLLINSNSGDMRVDDLTVTLKGVALSSPVTITKGTGVKSVYLSTSNTATSGSASGTEFTNGSTVYGFAELAAGYKSKSGWSKVSGTADTEGAKYRVGSVSAGSSNFGTVSADLITYSIGYTLNGGSVSGTNPTSYNVTSNDITLINPTRTGYTFKGWSGTGLSGDTNTSVKISKGSIGNRTYTANWTPINYTIGYTLNGGTATNPTAYNIETATFTLNNPTRTGYTFAGWTGSNGSTPQTSVSINTGSTGNKTYTANWTANQYTVTLNDNGGSGGQSSVSVIFDSKNFATPLTQFPTMEGYTFAGYYDEQNAAGAASPSGTLYIGSTGAMINAWDKPNDSTTLYAYYTKDMTVSSAGYEEDYDGNSHTITVTVTDPASGYFILYHDPETSSNTDVNPAKTNVGSYTIDFYVSKNGYTQYQGSATIVIKEVDKTALTDPLATDDSYYDNIKDDYSSIASDLKDVIDNIKNNIRDNANVTAAQVAQAVLDLQTALSTAKVDVTEAKIDAIGSGDYSSDKALAIQDARSYYDDELTDEEKALVDSDKLTALEDAEALYGPVGEVVAEINALQTITDLQALKTAVQTARAHYEALDPNMQAVFPDDDLDDLVDFETIIPVIEKVNALGTPEDTDAFRTAVSSARADYESLSANQQALFPDSALKVLTDDEAVVSAMDTIKALSAPADTPEFRDAVSAARTQFDALTDDQEAIFPAGVKKVLTDDEAVIDVMDTINALGAPADTDAFREDVEDARDDFDALTDDQKAIFPASVSKTLEDDEAVVDVMDTINALKDVADPKDYKQEVEDAGDAYDALSADQKALFPSSVYDTLEDYEAIVPIVEGINAIGTPENTQDFRDKSSQADSDFNALSPERQALVPESVKKVLEDDKAIIPVMDAIDALSAPADTPAFRTDVENTRADFDALSDDQKAIFPADVLKTLEDDEAVIDVMDEIKALGDFEYTPGFEDKLDEARGNFDALSDDQKAIFPSSVQDTLVNDEKAYDAMAKIEAIGKPVANDDATREKADVARDAYDALTPEQRALIDPDFIEDLEDAEDVIDFMDKVNAIGTPEDTQSFRDKVAEALNTCDNELTPNQLALVPEDVIKALTDDEALVPVMDAIGAIGNPANTDSFREASGDARDVYAALTDDQKAIFPADVLKTLEDDESVIEVLDVIDSIGDVEYSEGSEARIDAARSAYDSLSADQKAKFPSSDLQTLVDDEKAYEAMGVVYNIGEIENNAETKERIAAARAAYDALTPDQKALVAPSFVKNLEDAEAVYDAIEQINAIGDVGYDDQSEEAIRAAREAYDGLSEDQKALMPQSAINDLEADEQTFASKSGDAKKLYIALLVVLAIALCVAICFLCFQFIKRKNSKKQEKVMSSVLIVPAILAASYYVSAPFVAIYVLSALLLVVVAADIFLAVKHKKDKEEQAKAEKKAEQQKAKSEDESPEDARNYVCIADESEPTYDLRHDPVAEEPQEQPEEGVVEEPAEEVEEEVAADSADEDEKVAEEELEQEEELKEEPAPVEDVKKEEPITLKQSMSVAKHSVHSMKWNKKAIANDLRDRHAGEVEINERENYTSTGLPLADTHYAVEGKTRKCFIYVYETEGAPMLLINSDADLAEELNNRHGNVHKSAFPKSKDLWFSLPLDDSYSQEEVQSILDRCHAYALGRDEKEFSLKESLALAKNVKSAHSQSKKSICEYLEAKYGDQVELNTRDNYTSTGLPLADTHYVKGEDGKSRCFVYVYETEGSMMLLTRSNYDFAKELKENHENVHRSAFPKAKEPWNMVLLDDSFSDEEVHELLDKLVALNK